MHSIPTYQRWNDLLQMPKASKGKERAQPELEFESEDEGSATNGEGPVPPPTSPGGPSADEDGNVSGAGEVIPGVLNVSGSDDDVEMVGGDVARKRKAKVSSVLTDTFVLTDMFSGLVEEEGHG